MILNIPEFIAKARKRGHDPFALLARFEREWDRLSDDQRTTLTADVAKVSRAIADAKAKGLEEPFFPCGWCRQDNGYWNPWCGWWHWWVCGWVGFGCVDCGDEPPAELPQAA